MLGLLWIVWLTVIWVFWRGAYTDPASVAYVALLLGASAVGELSRRKSRELEQLDEVDSLRAVAKAVGRWREWSDDGEGWIEAEADLVAAFNKWRDGGTKDG